MKWWLRLAWLEWQRSFFQGKQNWDFFWLTILLFLALLLAVFLKGTQEGLLDKFVNVSIGYVEEAGIPIWITTNIGKRIDRTILNNSNIKLYPYREIEPSEVALLDETEKNEKGEKIWKDKNFVGWAVAFNDPLWQVGMKNQESPILNSQKNQSNIPLTVILNESLFKKFFNCNAYLDKLYSKLPFLEKIDKKEGDSDLYCLKNQNGISELWLDVSLSSQRRELLPFRVYWQTHIPSIENLALLMPISILNVLAISRLYTELGYDPLFPEGQENRVKQVREFGNSNQLEEVKKNCFPNSTIQDNSLILDAIPEKWFSQCVKKLGIQLLDVHMRGQVPEKPYLQVVDAPPTECLFHYSEDDILTISCKDKKCEDTISKIQQSLQDIPNIAFCEGQKPKIDVVRAIGGYDRAFTYVHDRIELNPQVEKIKNFSFIQSDKHFYIPITYEDALIRFTFIDKVMSLFKRHYAKMFLIFLSVLLLVQVGIVISHRKHNYGIYLSKGISWLTIYFVILTQITLSFLIASVIFTPFAIEILRIFLSNGLREITTTEPYVSRISANNLDLLPVSIYDYMIVSFIFLAVLYLITVFLFQLTISKRCSEPASLL